MPAAFLCVQFQNLLPSEELVRFARDLWTDAQLHVGVGDRDVTLAIRQTPGELEPFEVKLMVGDAPLPSTARDADARSAVQSAFAQLGSWRSHLVLAKSPARENCC